MVHRWKKPTAESTSNSSTDAANGPPFESINQAAVTMTVRSSPAS